MSATMHKGRARRRRDIVVVGASAGGVEALKAFFAGLPRQLEGSVLIVLHVPNSGASMLDKILDRVGTVPTETAPGAESRLQLGRAMVAPPGFHLMLVDDHIVLTRGPLENGHRPAVDVLFRSAARAADGRVIGVVLSGALDDGTAGMLAIRQRNGLVLAQDPDDALYPSMPRSVINNVGADHVASATRLGELVGELCGSEVAAQKAESSQLLDMEVGLAAMDDEAMNANDRPGRPSGFSCPNCSGSLFEIDDDGVKRYRCRVGHAWSSLGLLAEQADSVDSALWMALRSLEEKAELNRQLADRSVERGNRVIEQRYLERAAEAMRSASVVRQLLEEPLLERAVSDLGESAEGGR